jgi:predicted membrane channel-forming protein YqfA (hemolysin III family)
MAKKLISIFVSIVSLGATRASDLLRNMALTIIAVVGLVLALLGYFMNVHPKIEERYGSAAAWTIMGCIGTLLVMSIVFLLMSCSGWLQGFDQIAEGRVTSGASFLWLPG